MKKFVTASTSTAATIFCNSCNVSVPREAYVGHVKSLLHKATSCRNVEEGIEVVESAFRCRIVSYRVTPQRHHIIYREFFEEVAGKITKLLVQERIKHKNIKVNMELFGRFLNQTKELVEVKSFNTQNKILTEGSDIERIYDDFAQTMETKAQEFEERDSGKYRNRV